VIGHLNFGSTYPTIVVETKPIYFDLVENNCHFEVAELRDPLFAFDFIQAQQEAGLKLDELSEE